MSFFTVRSVVDLFGVVQLLRTTLNGGALYEYGLSLTLASVCIVDEIYLNFLLSYWRFSYFIHIAKQNDARVF